MQNLTFLQFKCNIFEYIINAYHAVISLYHFVTQKGHALKLQGIYIFSLKYNKFFENLQGTRDGVKDEKKIF